jgi:hypothetical protein
MESLSALTPASQRKLCKAVSMADLEDGLLKVTPAERQEWERRMIIKYSFKVRP